SSVAPYSITLFSSMPLPYPETHTSGLQQRLTAPPDAWVLVCYCAAWCRTCAGFETAVEQFARAHPDTICVWVDIEEHEDLLMDEDLEDLPDRKSTRLNSSHVSISYAVFCLKKKKNEID